MKYFTILSACLVSLNAFASFETTNLTSKFGSKQFVTLEHSTKFELLGKGIKVGEFMPSVLMMTSDLDTFDTGEMNREVKIYSVLTSVDTPVCVQQAKELSDYIENNKKNLTGISFYAISADTPFAQQRFIKENKLTGVRYLSDSNNHSFGLETGSQIKELGLLSRSIIVVDKNNQIIYTQRVPELTTIPNLKAAIHIAKSAVAID